ncbi:glycosyltransferase family 4 protein, partial [Photorhabdus aegyptia]|uniref:glycosyltransferase family 4 protein n=1 Tax=Photorhabdus aegyptia TaxID=2805098 RepID=UPI001E45709C
LVCSNGVDLSRLTYRFCPNRKKEIIFIGNMNSVQNYDAVLWFSNDVLPLLRQHGDYQLKIIGRIKKEYINRLKSMNGIIITGLVEDISKHARGAIAGICSVRLAAGVQNKILEYMALGIPTISTSIGLEGLDAIPDKDIIIANSPEEYVKSILKLEKDKNYAKNISISAFNYVNIYHSWHKKLEPLLRKIHQLLNKD